MRLTVSIARNNAYIFLILNKYQPDTQINPSAPKLKVFGIIIRVIFSTLTHCFQTIGVSLFSGNKDKLQVRSKVDNIIRTWGVSLVNAAKLEWSVKGDYKSQITEGRSVIFMCNHSSAFDIPLGFVAFPESIRMIAKKELFNIPIFSKAMRVAEFCSIDRQNREQAILDLKIAEERMASGIRMWMFPEGTRASNGELRSLKKGGVRLAIDTDAIIIPVVMQHIHHVLPNKKWLKLRLHQKVNVRVGQAIDCQKYAMEDRHQVSDLVYNEMKQLLSLED